VPAETSRRALEASRGAVAPSGEGFGVWSAESATVVGGGGLVFASAGDAAGGALLD
jgi:hypothetical protein